MKLFPNENKTFIRAQDRATYTWLHKYDNQWLKENSPCKNAGVRTVQVVDWNERDDEILLLVKEVVKELKHSKDKPMRITKTLVAKKINKVTLIQRNLDRLPKTKDFLYSNLESLEEFQLRRVRWAIRELSKKDEVNEWDVIIMAGLSKKFYKNIRNYIRDISIL